MIGSVKNSRQSLIDRHLEVVKFVHHPQVHACGRPLLLVHGIQCSMQYKLQAHYFSLLAMSQEAVTQAQDGGQEIRQVDQTFMHVWGGLWESLQHSAEKHCVMI